MFELQTIDSDNKVLKVTDVSFLLLSDTSGHEDADISESDAVIITKCVPYNQIIKQLRTNSSIDFYLTPVFVSSELNDFPDSLKPHIDGFVSSQEINEAVQLTKSILSRKKEIASLINRPHDESDILLRAMRYFYSRGASITPIQSRDSHIGYLYPFVSLFFSNNRQVEALELMNEGNKIGYFRSGLTDIVHHCQNCEGTYLHFRETCPECSSISLGTQSLLHHFVCAHVAPEHDFTTNNSLTCPKCSRTLKHIGVDYDKPSTIYACTDCKSQFQENIMTAKCTDCGHVNNVEDLRESQIRAFSLTDSGRRFAESGEFMYVSQSQSVNVDGIHDMAVFNVLFNQELQRITITKSVSFVGKLLIDVNKLPVNIQLKGEEFAKEIRDIMKSVLEPKDSISSKNYYTFYILLPESSKTEAEDKTLAVRSYLSHLLWDNFNVKEEIVDISFRKIESGLQLEDL